MVPAKAISWPALPVGSSTSTGSCRQPAATLLKSARSCAKETAAREPHIQRLPVLNCVADHAEPVSFIAPRPCQHSPKAAERQSYLLGLCWRERVP